MAIYDNYVWRLVHSASSTDIQLPQDLEWIDEFAWNKVQQDVSYTLTGSLVVQESLLQNGRSITLQGKQDMGWITRDVCVELKTLADTPGAVMQLSYVEYTTSGYGNVLHEFNVMFRHIESPVIDISNVLGYDDFEPGAYFSVNSIKFIETAVSSTGPCTANVQLTISNISGTFQVGETITGGTSSTLGTVVEVGSGTLGVYVRAGTFQVNEAVTGGLSGATADIDSIA
jgi:hypothetical protein